VHIQPPNCEIVKENCSVLQSARSQLCGYHCLYFICHRSFGISYENIMNKYTPRVRYNDRMVKNFVDHIPFLDPHACYSNQCVNQNCVSKVECPEFL